MKKIINLLFFLILLISQSKAQTLSPDQNQEYCPNTNYNFVISVAGTVTSVTPSGGCSVVSILANAFTGRFNDANVKQTFTVNYKDINGVTVSFPFEFKKVKSLVYSNSSCGYIQPNQTTITAPSCQVNTIPISFNNLQWNTSFESSIICFGSVTTYEYQIPVGWKLGATTCVNSNQWLAGSNNVSIVTDANGGDGGSVRIRPINSGCGVGLQSGYDQTISIPIKRNPIFSINPSSFQVPCGTSTTKTVTVNLSIPSGCTVSYNWSLSNPFTYSYPTGGFVPQTFTTLTPTFTFVAPAFSGVLPSISVTPVFNGVSQPTLICTASRTPLDPSQYAGFDIVGGNTICPSASYSAINIPAGFTIDWYTSTYPYGASVAQINSPTSPQTTVTAIGSGVISLIATITNQCGQQVSVTKSNISVGGGVSTINGYFTNYLGQFEGLKTNYQGINYIKPNYWTNVVVSNPELSSATWSWVTGGYNYWTQYQYPPTGGNILQMSLPVTNNIVLYRLTNNSSCGTQAIDFLFWAKNTSYGLAYNISPNPANDIVKVESLSTNAETQQSKLSKSIIAPKEFNSPVGNLSTIKAIEIVDMTGIIRYQKDCSNLSNNVLIIPVDKLNNGVYIMKIFNGKEWKAEKIVIQH